MRTTSFLLSAVVCLAIAAAYFFGHYMGIADAQEAGADALFKLDAARSAEAFRLAGSVRQALREGKPSEAELALVHSAALKAPSLAACSASPDCAAAVGRQLPTKAQLQDAVAAERAMNGPR